MKTEIFGEDIWFVFVSPKGVESDWYDPKEAEEAIKAGEFKVKTIVDNIGVGPSTEYVYRTDTHKIAKVIRIVQKTVRETEDITDEIGKSGFNGTGFALA